MQVLIIKLLEIHYDFRGTFEVIFLRGFIQNFVSLYFIYNNTINNSDSDSDSNSNSVTNLFGKDNLTRFICFCRGFFGFTSFALALLAVELIPIGDSQVLVMMAPLWASMAAVVVLGEKWRFTDSCCTVLALIGAMLVVKPSFLFGSRNMNPVGYSYAMMASVFSAIAFISIRMLGTTSRIPWPNVILAQGIGAIVLAIPSSYLFGHKFTLHIGLIELVIIVMCGSIATFSQIIMTIGMQNEKSAVASTMRMSDIVFSFIWQASFTSDKINPLSCLGAFTICVSIATMAILQEKHKESTIVESKFTQLSTNDDDDDDVGIEAVLQEKEEEIEIEIPEIVPKFTSSTNTGDIGIEVQNNTCV